jgi:anti-sigma-K factor RskA
MRIAQHPLLDALCGEYLVGTLRGAARRRFERALKEEPLARSRLENWQRFLPNPVQRHAAEPSPAV